MSLEVSSAARVSARGPFRRSRTGLVLVALLALAIAGISLATYATNSLVALAGDEPSVAAPYVSAPLFARVALYAHIVVGSFALVVGPLQFWRGARDRFPLLHRITGRGYLIAVGIASIAGLVIAPFNSAGIVGLFGFGGLAIAWAATAWRGYRAARDRVIPDHQAWMIRNYALTFAAVTLRLWLGALIAIQVLLGGASIDPVAAFGNAYTAVPFLCWIPNLLVAEWLIRRRGLPSYRSRLPRGDRTRSGDQ